MQLIHVKKHRLKSMLYKQRTDLKKYYKKNRYMRDMMTILQMYCVQRIGPANPHWAIYYFKAIVHNPNQVIIYVTNAFF